MPAVSLAAVADTLIVSLFQLLQLLHRISLNTNNTSQACKRAFARLLPAAATNVAAAALRDGAPPCSTERTQSSQQCGYAQLLSSVRSNFCSALQHERACWVDAALSTTVLHSLVCSSW